MEMHKAAKWVWLHSLLAVCYDNKMASKSDCFCVVFCNEDRRQFPGLSSCLNHALTNGLGIRQVLVEEPIIRELCDQAGDQPPPAPQLGEEADYFRPSSTQSPSANRSTSSRQLQLVNTSDHQGPELHLQYACVHGLPEALQLVLSNSPSIDLNSPIGQSANNEEGLTPLSWTALNNGSMAKPLISGGAGLDVRDGLGRTALHWAVVGGRSGSVKTLLKLGSDYSIADDKGLTPLHYACVLGLHEMVTSLLKESTTQVNVLHQPTGSTPLMLACLQGHNTVVKLLLKSRASPLATNKQGLTPLHCSVWLGESKCVKAVLASVGRDGVDARDVYGRTPLHIAALKGHVGTIQLLLKKGSSLSAVDNEGRTTLHWALLSQQISCVECVLGLDSGLVNQPDGLGATPLHYAATGASNHLTKLLITKGGDATLTDVSGHGPLLWASVCACDNNIRCLLSNQNEASSSSSTNQNVSALVAAASVGAEGACQIIIKHDKNCADAVSCDGYTALHLASRFGHTNCVQCLLKAGVTVDTLSPTRETSLHLACSGGHVESTAVLLSRGADQTLPLQGQWPIHIVSGKGYSKVLEVLIKHNATVLDTLTGDGLTPLHLAAAGGHLDCCNLLVTNGCDKDATLNNVEKHTALDLAMLAGHSGCADYLQSVGTPSSGGRYHRAAITIQHVWRFHRHKRRLRVRREWCAIVIQRSVREWFCWRAAVRVRAARRRHQHRAATIIQRRWRVFIRHKRRYEASCAQLRARLHQETLATTLILSQLHLNAQSISLPTPVSSRTTQHHGPSARYLLQASSNPAPIFPSGSLLFPAKPRTPLASRGLPRGTHTSRPSPRTKPAREMTSSTRNTASGANVRLPPVKSLPLTLAPDQHETNRGSPVAMRRSLKQVDISRSSPVEHNIARASSDIVNQVEVIRSSPILGSQVSSVDKLPAIPSQPSLVSTVCSDNHKLQQSSPKRSSIQLPSQAQLKLIRRSTFKDTPLKLSLISKQQTIPKEDLEPPILPDTSPEPVVELTNECEDEESLPPVSEVGVSSVLLNNIQRYDKLNQILSLLHVAKDGGCKEQEGEQLSRLKEQIMGALDEAVRLRAETQALTDKVSNQPISS